MEVQGDGSQRWEWLGRWLVVLQFALLAALPWLAWGGLQSASPVAWVLAACGVALGLWAVVSNRPGNFNIRPTPHPQGRLIREGPYRWIRHPMYSALLLFGVACALAGNSLAGCLAVVLLAVVLFCKALIEEQWMQRQHPAYGDYRAITKRFFPGIL